MGLAGARFVPARPQGNGGATAAALVLHRINLSDGAVLETGCVYIVPLLESLKLPKGISAAANPKSSTGRLDIFTRVIADHAQEFDKMPEAYEGPLYAEISPSDLLHPGAHRLAAFANPLARRRLARLG